MNDQTQILVPTRALGEVSNAPSTTAFVQNAITNPLVAAITSPYGVDTYGAGANSGVAAGKFYSSDSTSLTATERYTFQYGNTSQGTGDGSVPGSTYVLGISAIKANWQTTTVPGQFGGLNIFARGGHANALNSGDTPGWLVNVGVSQTNNFSVIGEATSGYFPLGSTTNSLYCRVTLGPVRSSGLGDVSNSNAHGFTSIAQNGALTGAAYYGSNLKTSPAFGNAATWAFFLKYDNDDGVHAGYTSFSVTPAGAITSGGVGGVGSLTLNGSTSGSATINVSATGTPQYPGTPTNDNAAAGGIGEFISSTIVVGSAVSLTSGTSANLTSISLTAGDWDVWGIFYFLPAATTNVIACIGSLSLTTATLDTSPGNFGQVMYVTTGTVVGNNNISVTSGPRRVSISATTTIFAVANSSFGTSTLGVYGILRARRVR